MNTLDSSHLSQHRSPSRVIYFVYSYIITRTSTVDALLLCFDFDFPFLLFIFYVLFVLFLFPFSGGCCCCCYYGVSGADLSFINCIVQLFLPYISFLEPSLCPCLGWNSFAIVSKVMSTAVVYQQSCQQVHNYYSAPVCLTDSRRVYATSLPNIYLMLIIWAAPPIYLKAYIKQQNSYGVDNHDNEVCLNLGVKSILKQCLYLKAVWNLNIVM